MPAELKSGEYAMRMVAVSLIALLGAATAAAAQAPADPAPAPAAPAAEAPAATAPLPPPPAGSTTSPTTQAAPDPAANPTLPTAGDGAAVISVIDKLCVPLVRGGNFDQLAAAAGGKKNRRDGSYTIIMGAKPYSITVAYPGSNANVCSLTLNYALGQERPIITGLNIWAFLHDPELKLQRNDFVVGADSVKRITLSWEYFTDKTSTGLVFVQLKKPDDSPLNAKFDQATLLYSERTF